MHQSTPPLPGFNAIRIDYIDFTRGRNLRSRPCKTPATRQWSIAPDGLCMKSFAEKNASADSDSFRIPRIDSTSRSKHACEGDRARRASTSLCAHRGYINVVWFRFSKLLYLYITLVILIYCNVQQAMARARNILVIRYVR